MTVWGEKSNGLNTVRKYVLFSSNLVCLWVWVWCWFGCEFGVDLGASLTRKKHPRRRQNQPGQTRARVEHRQTAQQNKASEKRMALAVAPGGKRTATSGGALPSGEDVDVRRVPCMDRPPPLPRRQSYDGRVETLRAC